MTTGPLPVGNTWERTLHQGPYPSGLGTHDDPSAPPRSNWWILVSWTLSNILSTTLVPWWIGYFILSRIVPSSY